jgi:hypothetical protein
MSSCLLQKHQALIAIANNQNCTASSLEDGGVSMHTLPETASFSNVDALARATNSPTYIGTSEGALMFSAHLERAGGGEKKEEAEEEEEEEERRPKKRRRANDHGAGDASEAESEDARKIAAARSRLQKSVPELQGDELDVAQKVLTKLVGELRGPAGEVVVQSTAMLAKKLAPDDERQRVVVAARLNAGVAMRIDALRACMGTCWADGLLTTLPTLHGIGSIELPLSEEARAASQFGNAAVLLVTSVTAK